MESKIMVALDGSEAAEAALETAIPVARKLQAKLVLVRATVISAEMWDDNPGVTTFADILEIEQGWSEDYLSGVAAAYPDQTFETIVVEGVAGLVEFARVQQFALIVLSTRGHTGLTRWWCGSVTEKLVRYSGCSVLVLPAETEAQPRSVLFSKVLIALDGSELAEQSLELAKELADEEITLLRCLEVPGLKSLLPPSRFEDFVREERRSCNTYLTEVEDRLGHHKVNRRVVEGHPATEIVKAAESLEVDLIAMTSRGRGGLKRWLLGSVAEKVVRSAKTPVLVVRQRPESDDEQSEGRPQA